MTAPSAARAPFYRLFFALAAAWNLAFALWVIVRPHGFFDRFAMEVPRSPALWQCLGMVVGVYGLAYGYAARRLDRALPIIALGLLGKVLVPIGWAAAARAGEWPIRTFTFILFDDLVWYLPFGLFLLERTRAGERLRAAAPYLCAALNFAAALAIPLALAPGMEIVPDPAARVAYITAHPALWRGGWSLWIAAALSLLGFYAWWAARVRSLTLGMTALSLAIAGIGGDLLAESLYIGWLPAGYERIAPLARLLTGVWGNLLYTIAGVLLMLDTDWLSGPARACGWAIWILGFALGFFAFTGNVTGLSVAMALLFILFCPWVVWVGLMDRRRAA